MVIKGRGPGSIREEEETGMLHEKPSNVRAWRLNFEE